ncbi:protein FAM110A-like [Stigmatopora nigra]
MPVGAITAAATFPRLRPAPGRGGGTSKPSAAERLAADRAKYVKSWAASSMSASTPASPLAAALRRSPAAARGRREAVRLDLRHLSSLIGDVNEAPAQAAPLDDVPREAAAPSPPSRPARAALGSDVPSASSRQAQAKSERSTSGTVRRVDVIPQADGAIPGRAPPFLRRPPPTRPPIPRLLFLPRPGAASDVPSVRAPAAFHGAARRSPSRSKSDASERSSRAGTELERFFDLCGTDAAALPDRAGSVSDSPSGARFRSVSAPGSERTASSEGEERLPAAVSVVDRNARVIKWLYQLRRQK